MVIRFGVGAVGPIRAIARPWRSTTNSSPECSTRSRMCEKYRAAVAAVIRFAGIT